MGITKAFPNEPRAKGPTDVVDRAKDLYKAGFAARSEGSSGTSGQSRSGRFHPCFLDATVMVFYQLLVPVIANRWPWAMTARMVCKTALFFWGVLYKPSFFPTQSESVRIWLNELRLFVTWSGRMVAPPDCSLKKNRIWMCWQIRFWLSMYILYIYINK